MFKKRSNLFYCFWTGLNAIKLFTAVIYECSEFVPFQPSVLFVDKSGVFP
jgi:hypothetical protein